MTVLHTGWTKKFATGWDSIFGGKKKQDGKSKSRPAATAKKKSAKKQRPAKKAAKR